MFKKLLFSLLVCLQVSISEGQIFVDDVDRVAVVVIDYCVDDKGERYDMVINQEKSSYTHQGWQEGCLTHFKDAKLMFPMKMVNECWQAVYYFVNSKYKTYELPESDKIKCQKFHLGKYTYENPAYNDVIINRRAHKQIEKGGLKGDRQVYKIKWLADHIYELETIKLPLEKDKHKEGNIIRVEIIELINDNTYLYKAIFTNVEDSDYLYGLITKIE
ncbi:hypothetical protein [uncultured Psychroserpens sp.]|uniref:hypothetical protein n=1 Tax=uncultured Psychroserpens sp. TaxID=255436 RepID=UPI002606F801|nr:hypothetical protein [uncultured Psychroserpens sp.]